LTLTRLRWFCGHVLYRRFKRCRAYLARARHSRNSIGPGTGVGAANLRPAVSLV